MKQNKNLKTHKIEVRVRKEDKKKLLIKATKSDISISEYVRNLILNDICNNNMNRDNIIYINEIITLATELVRCVETRCDKEDEQLRKKVDELWDKLQ